MKKKILSVLGKFGMSKGGQNYCIFAINMES